MFNFIKQRAKKVYDSFSTKLSSLFSRTSLNQEFIDELQKILITSDVGIKTSRTIIDHLQTQISASKITSPTQVKDELERLLTNSLSVEKQRISTDPRVVLLVGINGSGKTTFAAKYAHLLKTKGKKVMLVAADTFRAAGVTQLEQWAKDLDITVCTAARGTDPASLIFEACEKYKREAFDTLIIDTAGRLQTKVNLMKELEKVRKVIGRQLPDRIIETWLTIDAMIGQNSFMQAEVFHQATDVTGLIVSKLDSSAKGGVVFSIVEQFALPIRYVTHGEKVTDIAAFEPESFTKSLFESV